jgi:tRNA modification GTPase
LRKRNVPLRTGVCGNGRDSTSCDRRSSNAGGLRTDGVPTLTRPRQRDALALAEQSLRLALDGWRRRNPPELVAVDVQAALDHIGSITGAVTSEDVLDRIFSEFCIGK